MRLLPPPVLAPKLSDLAPGMVVFTADGCRWIVDSRGPASVTLVGGHDWRVVGIASLHTIVDYDSAPTL